MDKIMIIDDKFKRKMAIICFMPAVAFFIAIAYYTYLLLPLAHGYHIAQSVVGITSRNYNTMFLLLAIASSISAGVLLYCIVHLVRIKTMNTRRKIEWVLLLLAVPVSFILFWFLEIKKEPRNMPVYPNID